MSNVQSNRAVTYVDLQREVLAGRKYSLAEAIGRLGGAGVMKGVSPVARKQQAIAEIQDFLNRKLTDSGDILAGVLTRHVGESELLINNLDSPRAALATFIQQILDSDQMLKDIVSETDMDWGRAFDEQPYFEIESQPACADDPYTDESVRVALTRIVDELKSEKSS